MPEDFFDAGGTVERLAAEALVVDLDGFEGPLDLLLTLARSQKVDLRRISILRLAEQYLGFVEAAKRLRIELAADYLVMAAWLAYLKSRLLLPPDPAEAGPSGDDLAAHLAFQLQRLEAMRGAAAELMARDQLGRDVFARGVTEAVRRELRVVHTADMLDLLRAYARVKTREDFTPLHLERGPSCQHLEAVLEPPGRSVPDPRARRSVPPPSAPPPPAPLQPLQLDSRDPPQDSPRRPRLGHDGAGRGRRQQLG